MAVMFLLTIIVMELWCLQMSEQPIVPVALRPCPSVWSQTDDQCSQSLRIFQNNCYKVEHTLVNLVYSCNDTCADNQRGRECKNYCKCDPDVSEPSTQLGQSDLPKCGVFELTRDQCENEIKEFMAQCFISSDDGKVYSCSLVCSSVDNVTSCTSLCKCDPTKEVEPLPDVTTTENGLPACPDFKLDGDTCDQLFKENAISNLYKNNCYELEGETYSCKAICSPEIFEETLCRAKCNCDPGKAKLSTTAPPTTEAATATTTLLRKCTDLILSTEECTKQYDQSASSAAFLEQCYELDGVIRACRDTCDVCHDNFSRSAYEIKCNCKPTCDTKQTPRQPCQDTKLACTTPDWCIAGWVLFAISFLGNIILGGFCLRKCIQ